MTKRGGGPEDHRASRASALKRSGARETISNLDLSYSRCTPETQLLICLFGSRRQSQDELITAISGSSQMGIICGIPLARQSSSRHF